MKKNYTYFEDVLNDKDPYIYHELALVGYEYDRMFKKYRVYGYDYIPKKVGFYLGGCLVSTDLKKEDVADVKKHLQSIIIDKEGRIGYRGK